MLVQAKHLFATLAIEPVLEIPDIAHRVTQPLRDRGVAQLRDHGIFRRSFMSNLRGQAIQFQLPGQHPYGAPQKYCVQKRRRHGFTGADPFICVLQGTVHQIGKRLQGCILECFFCQRKQVLKQARTHVTQ